MQPFRYERASSAESALHAMKDAATGGSAQYIAGGTNLTDYMTLDVLQPHGLIDINALASEHGRIDIDSKGLRLGALVRMSQAEDHPGIRSDYPVIHETLLLAASRQIRNMASLGGNVLQRTRCEYFRERSWPCNKRKPGSGCAALDGLNRQHAILGASDHCIATYPGDFAQALIALDAEIETRSAAGASRRPFAELHVAPGNTPHIETTLAPEELIVAIHVPAGPWTRRSHYVKVRDRESYEFAITSAAVALHMEGDVVRDARIALGGVATTPWRAREAEALLKDKTLDVSLAEAAAAAAFQQAKPRAHNAFKVDIGKQTVVRALLETQALKVNA